MTGRSRASVRADGLMPVAEAELWRRLRTQGCDAAGEELVRRYMPLAMRLSNDHARRASRHHEDCRSAAYLGLVKAVARFDPERGNSFAVYARTVIRGEVLRHLRADRYVAHVPRPLHERWMALRGARRDAALALGREPSAEDLGAWLGWDADVVGETAAVATAERSATLAGTDEHRDRQDVARSAVRTVAVGRALAGLDRRLRHVVVRRFRDEATQAQIAGELGLSQAHVSRLLGRALGELREVLGDETPVPALA